MAEYKETAINYTLSSNNYGIEYPGKITPVGLSQYDLIDAHHIDWDTSTLKYLTKIPRKIFVPFAAVRDGLDPGQFEKIHDLSEKDTRARYTDSTDYGADSGFDTPPASGITDGTLGYFAPAWYKQSPTSSSVCSSAHLLDIIDYLTFATSYTFLYFDELNTIQSGIIPDLSFTPSEVNNIFGEDNFSMDANNIENLQILVAPNQRTKDSESKGYDTLFQKYDMFELNEFTLTINANDLYHNPITDVKFYYDNGRVDPDNNTSLKDRAVLDVKKISRDPFTFLKGIQHGANTGVDIAPNKFLLTVYTDGWEPKEDKDSWTGYNDVVYNNYFFFTTPINLDKYYSQSNELKLGVKLQKDLNIFEYVFINDVQYFFLRKGFFDSCYEDHKTILDNYKNKSFLINTSLIKDFKVPTTPEQEKTLAERIIGDSSKGIETLLDKMICVGNYDGGTFDKTRLINILNDKPFTIEVYPKYYGDYEPTDSVYPWFNYKVDGRMDEIRPKVDYTNSITTTTPTISTKATGVERMINGVMRQGFSTKINIIQNVNDRTENRYTEIDISTNATYYVSAMRMGIQFRCVPSQFVYFVDSRRYFNYAVTESTGNPTESLKRYSNSASSSTTTMFQTRTDELFNQNNLHIGTSFCNFSVIPELPTSKPDKFTWYLRLPIFTTRSWIGNSISDVDCNTYIYPSILPADKLNNTLRKPGQPESVSETNKFYGTNTSSFDLYMPKESPTFATNYTAGYPSILIGQTNTSGEGFLGKEYFFDKKFLFYSIVAPTNDNSIAHWSDVSEEIYIDFERMWKDTRNQDFFRECDENFQKQTIFTGSASDEEKGKAFCGRYCGIKIETQPSNSKTIKTKKLVCYRPTIPDNFLHLNVEGMSRSSIDGKIDGIPQFILWLRVPDKDFVQSDGGCPNYEGNLLEVYLVVERAANNLAGWAKKSDTKYQEVATGRTLDYFTRYNILNLINSVGFSERANSHDIQTRLTSIFKPKITTLEPDNHYSSLSSIIGRHEIKFYYNVGDDYIQFYTQDKDVVSPYLKYRIDYQIQATLKGNMDSDELFMGRYDEHCYEYTLTLTRQDNSAFSIKNENNISKWKVINRPFESIIYNNKLCGHKAQFVTKPGEGSFDNYRKLKVSDIEAGGMYNSVNIFDEFVSKTSDYSSIYTDGTNEIPIGKLQLISLSGVVSKNGPYEYLEQGDGSTMWDLASPIETFSDFLKISEGEWDASSGTYVERYPQFNIDKVGEDNPKENVELNTSGAFNYLYDEIKNKKYLLNDWFTVDKTTGNIVFGQNLINVVRDNISTIGSLRLRIVGMLPMTDIHRGYVLDIRLILPFK